MKAQEQSNPDWPALVAQWQGSGLTKAAFCRRNGLVTSAFYREAKQLNKSLPPAFAKVKLDDQAPPALPTCLIELPTGLRITLNNPSVQLLKELIC